MAVRPRPPYSCRPVQPEPALLADLATERRQLPALVLEPVLGHLGPQRRGDVLREELPHFGDPRALLVVELEVHIGDTIAKLSTQRPKRMDVSRASMGLYPDPYSSAGSAESTPVLLEMVSMPGWMS